MAGVSRHRAGLATTSRSITAVQRLIRDCRAARPTQLEFPRSRPGWRPWTPNEVQELQWLLAAGSSLEAIAFRLKRSTGAVDRKIRRLRSNG